MFIPASFAVLGLSSIVSSHMMMVKPAPFSGYNNSPLDAAGTDYPCKLGGYTDTGPGNIVPLGSVQPLEFVGSAVHGGGSCQVSVTYDKTLTKDTKFKVIHSIMGGCPARNFDGNRAEAAEAPDPDKYTFPVPQQLPEGNGTLVWTWFNRQGNREMYMNCASATFTAPSGKRDLSSDGIKIKRDMEFFESLPDMFIANIANVGQDNCSTVSNGDTVFPNPGKSVESSLLGVKGIATPNGCGAPAGPAPGPESGSNTVQSSTPVPVNSGATSSSTLATVNTVSPLTSAATPNTMPQAAGTNGSDTAASSNTMPSSQPAQSTSVPSSGNKPDKDGDSTTHSVPASSNKSAGSQCFPEGAWNCLPPSGYQRCASGTWSAVMQLADGTTCSEATDKDMKISHIRRFSRISRGHLRRHLNSMKFR